MTQNIYEKINEVVLLWKQVASEAVSGFKVPRHPRSS